MVYTKYDDVNYILEQLLNGHKRIFGDKFAGFYLYGSLIWGDFNSCSSDIDTLCALYSEVDDREIELLRIMHEEITNDYKSWEHRIEVHYASVYGLKHFREFPFKMGNISPGEPLHIIDAGYDWVDEWYCVSEYAVTLYGADKSEIIPHIEKSEFLAQIHDYAQSLREKIKESRNNKYAQAYVILTLCRALYTLKTGEQTSKIKGAYWAADFLCEYKGLILNAVKWRDKRDFSSNSREEYEIAEKFTNEVIERFFNN